MADVVWPFAGLPIPIQIFFGVALALIVVIFLWTITLFVRGLHAARRAPAPGDPDDFLWVFFVPALNEEVTIRDSVDRLLSLDIARRMVLVIDDGSDDRTPEILGEISHPDLVVLRRDPPHAREGKAEALNHAYHQLNRIAGDAREEVIVTIVDADGRLGHQDPPYVAGQFRDPAVGGVQSLVRIYNRAKILAWFQDIEFSVYGRLFQAGRNAAGTAGMGGNGQFNRLSALDAIADEHGPWRDRLTEDQDLGLRLLAAGSICTQELEATVDQQGLSQLRPLFRQRTRWSQGNLQAMGLARDVWRTPAALQHRFELLLYLFMPIWQAYIGAAFFVALALAIFDNTNFWSDGPWWQLLFLYLLGFGGVVLGCITAKAQDGAKGCLIGFLIAHPYAFYTWMLWPVLLRAAARQLTERRDWSKTQREALPAGA